MREEEFTPFQSLQLIKSMIDKTKQGLYDRSFYFLLWGWGVFLISLVQFVLKVIYKYPYHYRIWMLMYLFFIVNVFTTYKRNKKQKVRSYMNESMKHLWLGITICFFMLIIQFSILGWQNCYPFFMIFYGLGTFVSGNLLKFKPLIVGGIISWLFASVSLCFNYDYQMLFACGALLASYIIPGHLLRVEYQLRVKAEEQKIETL